MSTDLLRRGAPVLFRVLVASVFGYAGLEKFLAPADFVEQIANYQWLPGWSNLLGVLLPPIELTSAAALLVGPAPWRRSAALLAALLLAMFTAAMAHALALGINVDCGCFGQGSGALGPVSVLRNLGLIACCAGVLGLDR